MVAIAPAKGARAPEKGSFPLDHGGECKSHMKVRALQMSVKRELGTNLFRCVAVLAVYLTACSTCAMHEKSLGGNGIIACALIGRCLDGYPAHEQPTYIHWRWCIRKTSRCCCRLLILL